MQDSSENNLDALAAAFRGVSMSELDVVFEPSNEAGYKISDATITFPNQNELHELRQNSDEAAARIRYHNDETHHRNMPTAQDEADIYNALEEMRCKIELGKKYSGSFKNINKRNHESTLPSSLANLLWERAFELQYENMAEALVAQNAADVFAQLLAKTAEQNEFGKLSLRLIQRLAESDGAPQNSETDEMQTQSVQQTTTDDEDNLDDQEMDSSDEDAGNAEPSEEEAANKSLKKSQQQDTTSEQSTRPNFVEPAVAEYRAYTTKFDEVVHASNLCDIVELTALRAQLDKKIVDLKTVTTKLAARLQQLLLAPKQRVWEYDKDDGLLDSRRFSSFIANPRNNNIYRTEKVNENKDTVVTLLIDNSGSMRGRPIMSAIACADILARVLEQCSVKVEILGFTTAEWKGGKSRKAWLNEGSPKNPGRLNDLRHIVYKSADSPWRKAKRNLGLALKDGLLKENIDGEAILWALKRLNTRQEKRKILMVISDGAPVDDSTISVNDNNFLDSHLKEVIANIEGGKNVELLAIGIGHNVNRYYQNAVTIRDISELGDKMFGKMEELFKKSA